MPHLDKPQLSAIDLFPMNKDSPFIPNRFHGLRLSIFNPCYLRLLADIARFCHPVEQKKTVRLFLRSLFWFGYSGKWFHQISNSPLLSALVTQEKNLAEKLHRHYLRRDYPIGKRFQLLSGHYEIAEQLIAQQLLQQALLKGGLCLSRIETTPGLYLDLVLGYGGYPGKEGELAIYMRQLGHSHDLAWLSFSFISHEDGYLLYLGGLQGSNAPNSRELVGQASKACSGLSPKRIVMEAVFALAEQLRIKAIIGISDEHHISSKKTAKYFRYNDFWLEFDALCRQDGDYSLPLVPTHKDIMDVPTKRRAKYRRQRALLEEVHKHTLKAFDSGAFNWEYCATASYVDNVNPYQPKPKGQSLAT
jgi:uncharacterized protein VirK/YbjX